MALQEPDTDDSGSYTVIQVYWQLWRICRLPSTAASAGFWHTPVRFWLILFACYTRATEQACSC